MSWSEQHPAQNEEKQPPLTPIQQGAEIFWALTPTGTMSVVSPSWQRFTGQDVREALGHGWLQVVHPADQQQMGETLSQAVLSRQATTSVCHLRCFDGTDHRVQIGVIPVPTTDGEVSEIVVYGNDLTSRVKAGQMDEAQIQLALRASHVGMWERDVLTAQVVWTDQCRLLFGCPQAQSLTYEGFLSALHPDDRERVATVMAQSVANQTEFHTEYRVIWPDGSVHWLTDRGRGISDAQGKPLRLVGAVTDVTELKQTEEALAASEVRFRRFIESNIVGIAIEDIHGTIHEANDAFLALVGYTRDDLNVGRLKWTTITSADYQERTRLAIDELLATGSFAPTELEYLSKTGQRVPVLVGGTLFHPDDPSRLGISFILDLTESKAIEQQKELFLGMASHELKTPLTALKGTLQLLQRHAQRLGRTALLSSPEGQRFVNELLQRLATALRQIDVQTRLINDLLDVSRITSNTLELSMQPADLVSLVRETVEDLRVIAPERALVLALPEQHTVPVLVDRDRIGQVVTNYLTNALRYAPVSEPITIGITIEDQTACVWVRDQGSGLSEQAQQNIWQRFHRVKGTPSHQSSSGQGLGLGLFICQTLIAQHGGQVGVQSIPGEGSTFWFRLPLR